MPLGMDENPYTTRPRPGALGVLGTPRDGESRGTRGPLPTAPRPNKTGAPTPTPARTRLTPDEARAQLGGRPKKNEGESIASYNRRLGKFQRQFANLTTGTKAKDRAALANQFAASGNAADADLAWWNGADYFTPGQLPPGYPGSTDRGEGGGGGDDESGPSSDFGTSRIGSMIDRLLSGEESPYGKDAIDTMKAQAFEDAAGGVEASNRDVVNRARRSGGLYSASAGSAIDANNRAGRSDVASASRAIDTEATTANFSAKMQGLQSGLALMAQERDERMANARNDVEREQIAMTYKGLMDSTNAKIKAEQENIQSQMQAEAASGRVGRDFQREMDALQWERELNRRAYEEPFRIYGASAGLGEE